MSIFLPTLGLLGIVAFMYWMAHMARTRLGLGAGTVAPDSLRVVGKRVLEPRKALYVVEVADRYVLVGTAEGSVSLIDHISADEFARMTDPVAADADTDTAALAAAADSPARDAIAAATAGGDGDAQRFMTVGESFTFFLDKARTSRRARRTVAGQVAAAASEDDR